MIQTCVGTPIVGLEGLGCRYSYISHWRQYIPHTQNLFESPGGRLAIGYDASGVAYIPWVVPLE